MTALQIRGDSVPRRAPNASWRDLGGETVVLDTRAGVLRGLNGTGGAAWHLADGSRSVAEIAREIAQKTGADEPRVQSDVVAFFEKLRTAGLLLVE
jgi:hypothetical protein